MDLRALRENGGLFLFLSVSKNIKSVRYIVILSLLALCVSCKTKKPVQVQETPVEEQGAFIGLALRRDSIQQKTSFRLSQVMVVKSKLRYELDAAKAKEANYVYLLISYHSGKTIEVNAEHPLFKRLDVYNESGKIESKSISLSQGELFVRVPYFGKIKTIKIRETIDFKPVQELVLQGNEK